MKKTRVIMSVILLFVSCGQQKTEWKGVIGKENGITVVKNPEGPMYGEEVFGLKEELSIGAAEGAEESTFLDAREVAVDDCEKIFVSDGKGVHIKVFDKLGNFITIIGRQGQGPGEFGQITHIQITPRNELMVYDRRSFKLTFFSLDGNYVRTIHLKGIQDLRIRENSNGNYFVSTVEFQGQYSTNSFRSSTEIREYGPDLAFIKTIARDKFRDGNVPLRHSMIARFPSFDTIICGYTDFYEFHIINLEGEIVQKVSKEYEPIAISEEEKEKRGLTRAKGIPGYFPAFQDFSVDEEGRIYVQTFERQGDGDQFYYDVFDLDGRFIAKVRLNAFPQCWKNGKMYTIEEDENGYQYVKRYKVTWRY